MIGLALVTLVATLAAGITSTFRGAVDDIFTSDYAITAQNNFSPIPTEAGEAAAQAPGVEAVASTRTGEARVFDSTEFVTAVEPDVGQGADARVEGGLAGGPRQPGRRTARSSTTATRRTTTCSIGSPIEVERAVGQRARARGQGDLRSAGRRLAVRDRDVLGETLRPRVRVAAEPLHVHPDARRRDRGEHAGARERRWRTSRTRRRRRARSSSTTRSAALNQILNILYVLLALSVIVSLFGIVNTLVLTVFERTREIGMLRAIGMTRRQVRRMIRHESVITALIGGVLGIVLGVVLGGAADRARRLHRVHAADRADHRLRDPDDRRRHHRRDLPGAPRGAARPAAGPPVRVGSRPCRPRTSIASGCRRCRILLFAGIDLVIALVLLLGNGFTLGFWAILAIGMVLAGARLPQAVQQAAGVALAGHGLRRRAAGRAPERARAARAGGPGRARAPARRRRVSRGSRQSASCTRSACRRWPAPRRSSPRWATSTPSSPASS